MNHYDELETRDPAQRERERERDLLARLPDFVADAVARAPAYAGLHAHVADPQALTSRTALAQLPVLRKSELPERRKAVRPFGGFAATRWGECLRVFASSGPLYEPEGARRDYWRLARALFAAGFRSGELIHNCFSYHFTPAGSMLETAAHALGCTVFPGGVGQTEQQVQAMADLQPDGYVGTPSFLRIILEKADELGVALPSVKKALVSGEAFPPALRDWLAARGVQGYQCYATADLGLIAYETPAREGLVVDEDVIVEIVRPAQVADVSKRHPQVLRARLVVDNPQQTDRMSLHCETSESAPELAEAIAATLRELTKLRGEVKLVAPGTLPNDGKVIEDARKYD